MRHPLWSIPITALLTLSCQNAANTQNTDNSAPPAIQEPALDPNSVILKSDDLTITMDEYHLSLATRKMQGQNTSKRALANPRFQRDEIQRCVQNAFLGKYAQTNHIAVSPALRQEILKQAFEKNGVQSEEKLCEKIEIACTDLDKVVEILALPRAIQNHLVRQLSEDEALKAYQMSYRELNMELASFDNTPTEQEAAEFVVNNKDQFSQYLGAHQDLLNTPPHAEFVRMAYATDAQDPDSAIKRAESLRTIAAQQGLDKALEQCRADEQSGCTILNDKTNLHEIERSNETAWAFRLSEGEIPERIHSENGEEIWVLEQVHAPEKRNLKDPAVQSTLAKKAMANTLPAPHLIDTLKAVLDQPNASLKDLAQAQSASYQALTTTIHDLVEAHKNKSADPLYSAKVYNILSTLNPSETEMFSNPVIDNDRLFVFIVHEIKIPTKADFESRKAQWYDEKASDPALGLVEKLLRDTMPKMSSLNIRPVQKEYGILQANGSIRY